MVLDSVGFATKAWITSAALPVKRLAVILAGPFVACKAHVKAFSITEECTRIELQESVELYGNKAN